MQMCEEMHMRILPTVISQCLQQQRRVNGEMRKFHISVDSVSVLFITCGCFWFFQLI